MKDILIFSFVLLCCTSVGFSVPMTRSTYRYQRLKDGRFRRLKRNYRFNFVPAAIGTTGRDNLPWQQQSRPLENQPLIIGVLPFSDPPLSEPRTPRTYFLNYMLPYSTGDGDYGSNQNQNPNQNQISYRGREYRVALPNLARSDNAAVLQNFLEEETSQQPNGEGRILGWLFGRPSYSPFPDYSVLESAAGISRYPYSSRPLPHHGSSSYVVEECTELLDPMTHEIIEDCYEVPEGY